MLQAPAKARLYAVIASSLLPLLLWFGPKSIGIFYSVTNAKRYQYINSGSDPRLLFSTGSCYVCTAVATPRGAYRLRQRTARKANTASGGLWCVYMSAAVATAL